MKNPETNNRVESLDWLRGLMAIAIMTYHLFVWLYHPLQSSYLLGRLGIYGVSVFFVLSGLSMAIVYSTFTGNIKSSVVFYIRRIFRIWPLLWICIAFDAIPRYLDAGTLDTAKIILNATTIFGFVNPAAYINTGAWSIGNEMVYYAITPLIFYLYNKSKALGNIFVACTFGILTIFAFFILTRDADIATQWGIYINPFNNLFLYSAGIAIFYNYKNTNIKPIYVLLSISIPAIIFVFYPVAGDKIYIVTGITRLVFVLASVLLVFGFFKFASYQHVPVSIGWALERFGIATYGVYLLHPIVNTYLEKLEIHSAALHFASVMAITVVVALFSFYFFESKLIRIGKKITTFK
jgi:exopolysaccharide production protein ExoZ